MLCDVAVRAEQEDRAGTASRETRRWRATRRFGGGRRRAGSSASRSSTSPDAEGDLANLATASIGAPRWGRAAPPAAHAGRRQGAGGADDLPRGARVESTRRARCTTSDGLRGRRASREVLCAPGGGCIDPPEGVVVGHAYDTSAHSNGSAPRLVRGYSPRRDLHTRPGGTVSRSLNKVMLIGNLGKDPEIKSVGSGGTRRRVLAGDHPHLERSRRRSPGEDGVASLRRVERSRPGRERAGGHHRALREEG